MASFCACVCVFVYAGESEHRNSSSYRGGHVTPLALFLSS